MPPVFLLFMESVLTNIDIREEFGKRLKFLRKYRRMCQGDLSRLSGVDRGYISEIENGRSAATIDLINRMAKAMNLHPSEFLVFGRELPKHSYTGKNLPDPAAESSK